MAKPKAPVWLRESFRDGVDEREPRVALLRPYGAANPRCWLAQHDPSEHPCYGPLERFHFLARQRVENALGDALRWATFDDPSWAPHTDTLAHDLILLAAWDPRNGGIGCEHHHRRYDGHNVSPRAPRILVPAAALPEHTVEFIFDYGLESAAEERFENFIRY